MIHQLEETYNDLKLYYLSPIKRKRVLAPYTIEYDPNFPYRLYTVQDGKHITEYYETLEMALEEAPTFEVLSLDKYINGEWEEVLFSEDGDTIQEYLESLEVKA